MTRISSLIAPIQSFRDWSNAKPLSDTLSRAEAGVRAKLQDAGARWLSFADIASITKAAPTSLLDLIWSQVDIVLRGGEGHEAGIHLKGYMPMRYPVSADPTQLRDALLLARETVWHDVGRTGVHARGQKMWVTDAGDMALLDLRNCDFGSEVDTGAALTTTAMGHGDAEH